MSGVAEAEAGVQHGPAAQGRHGVGIERDRPVERLNRFACLAKPLGKDASLILQRGKRASVELERLLEVGQRALRILSRALQAALDPAQLIRRLVALACRAV